MHQDYRECATRFIALAPVGNNLKEKWIYACSLQPISKMRMTDLLQATTDETPCPYDPEMLKQHQPGKVVKVQNYFYGTAILRFFTHILLGYLIHLISVIKGNQNQI